MKQLSRLGICLGPNATLSAIDRIRAQFDAAAVRLKTDIETLLLQKQIDPYPEFDQDLSNFLSETTPNIEEEMVDYPDLISDENILYSEGNISLLSFQKMSDDEEESDDNVSNEENLQEGDEEDDEAGEEEEIEETEVEMDDDDSNSSISEADVGVDTGKSDEEPGTSGERPDADKKLLRLLVSHFVGIMLERK